MKLRSIIAAVAVVAVAALCVRLGFWQLSRLSEKRALNAAMKSALTQPPVAVVDPRVPADSIGGRRVELHGRYDESRQILLMARSSAGSPGVHVVTPLVTPGGAEAVLVDRGWLYSADAASARPQDYPEPGERDVIGIAEPLRGGLGGPAVAMLPGDSVALYSMLRLDRDSLASRFPYPLAAFSVRQLPEPGVPEHPLRSAPRPYDEMMHLSYAIQWFLFATILVVGSVILATRRKRFIVPAPDPARHPPQ